MVRTFSRAHAFLRRLRNAFSPLAIPVAGAWLLQPDHRSIEILHPPCERTALRLFDPAPLPVTRALAQWHLQAALSLSPHSAAVRSCPSRRLSFCTSSTAASAITVPGGKIASAPAVRNAS